MLIQCPNCDTKYSLDESVLGPDGSKVRCIRCGHVFFVAPPNDASSAEAEQQEALYLDQEDGTDFDWSKPEPSSEERGEQSRSAPDVDEQVSGSGTAKEIPLEIQATEGPKGQIMTYVSIGVGLVIVALVLFLFSQQFTETFKSWVGSPIAEDVGEPEAFGPEAAVLISLQNVRQYFVTNEKIGQLFVIEGHARNDFPEPMELFRIEASLFDADGQVVETRELLAGNTISLFQLQILSEQEVEEALSARVGILSHNTNVQPRMEVPFMVVFPNPPETVQEYGLKVVGAQPPL